MTEVVNIRAYKAKVGSDAEDYVYIGRPTLFGNPFVIGLDGDRFEVIKKFRTYFDMKIQHRDFRDMVLKLKDKRLGCFCKPAACHGDVIVEWLDKP